MNIVDTYKEDFICYLNKKIEVREPENLYAPIHYILQIGGKRLRPILTIMTCDLFKGSPKEGQSVVIWNATHGHHGHDSLSIGTEFFFMVKKHKNDFKAFSYTYWVFSLTENMISIPIRDPLRYINIERKSFFTFLDLLIKNSSPEDARGFVDGELSKLKKLSPLAKWKCN